MRRTGNSAIKAYQFGQPPLHQIFNKDLLRQQAPATPQMYPRTQVDGTTFVAVDLGGPLASVGMYVEAGAKFDPVEAPGLSHVMRQAILTSNFDASLFQIDRTMRSTGMAYGHGEIRKRYLSWSVQGRRDLWQAPAQAMLTGIVAPRFHEADVERFRDTMDNALEEQRYQQPHGYVADMLETVAFFKEPLGNPRHILPEVNDRATQAVLVDQWASLFTPSRVTIAAVNVPLADLMALYANQPFRHSAEAPHHARSETPRLSHKDELQQYTPGREASLVEDRAKEMCTRPDMEQDMAVAIGWPTFGRDGGTSKYAAAAVAHEIISSSLLASVRDGVTVKATFRPFSTAGLESLSFQGPPQAVEEAVRRAVGGSPAKVTDESLVKRAKALAEARLFAEEREVNRDLMDFMATSPFQSDEFSAAVASLSIQQVNEALECMRSHKPCMYSTGSTLAFPSLRRLGLA